MIAISEKNILLVSEKNEALIILLVKLGIRPIILLLDRLWLSSIIPQQRVFCGTNCEENVSCL